MIQSLECSYFIHTTSGLQIKSDWTPVSSWKASSTDAELMDGVTIKDTGFKNY